MQSNSNRSICESKPSALLLKTISVFCELCRENTIQHSGVISVYLIMSNIWLAMIYRKDLLESTIQPKDNALSESTSSRRLFAWN